VLIPAFKKAGVVLRSVATSSGVSGVHLGRKFGFQETTTDTAQLLADERIDTVVIATPHDSHAQLVCAALRAGKQVFVEKPLCLTMDELKEIEHVYRSLAGTPLPRGEGRGVMLMVGFNRRFAPHIQKIKALLAGVQEPKVFVMTVNAGAIPPEHWTQDPQVGGGRLLGEGCHFVDLLRFLSGAPISDFQVTAMGESRGSVVRSDKVTFTLRFADGSFGTVHYLANGDKSFPKERLEIFCAGRVLQLDNFRKLRGYGWPAFRKLNLWRQDKGQQACADAFVQAIRAGSPAPLPVEEIFEVSRVTIELAEAVGKG
jgi:predicted dehydrogenase